MNNLKNKKRHPKNCSHLKITTPAIKKFFMFMIVLMLTIMCIISIILVIKTFGSEIGNKNASLIYDEYSYLESPKLNYYDNEKVEYNDLHINWTAVEAADKYKYNVILLSGNPDYGNDNEAKLEGSQCLAQNTIGTMTTSLTISKDEIQRGKWVKIAIAACKNNYEKWTSIYIFIKE